MVVLTKEILKHIGNNHTKVEVKEDFKGNYYSYITDTIYISKSLENKNEGKKERINKKAAAFVMLCHECIHSVQNKALHILNTVLSNLGIVLGIACIIIGIILENNLWLKLMAASILTISIFVRLFLENQAVKGSVKLAFNVVKVNKIADITQEDIQEGTQYINKYKWLALLKMVIDKIVVLIIILII